MRKVNIFIILWSMIGALFAVLLIPSFMLAYEHDRLFVLITLSLAVLIVAGLFGYGVRLAMLLPMSYDEIEGNLLTKN